MKKIIMIGLFTISSTAMVSATNSGGHSHEQAMKEEHGNSHSSDGHQGGGHAQSTVGMPVMAGRATKTINVDLLDSMRLDFAEHPGVKNGDIVKFVVTNKGQLPHEFSIGDKKEQAAHREMMRSMPNMKHTDGNTVSLKSGETKELTWMFMGNKEVIFACNVAGHYDAGMHSKAMIR